MSDPRSGRRLDLRRGLFPLGGWSRGRLADRLQPDRRRAPWRGGLRPRQGDARHTTRAGPRSRAAATALTPTCLTSIRPGADAGNRWGTTSGAHPSSSSTATARLVEERAQRVSRDPGERCSNRSPGFVTVGLRCGLRASKGVNQRAAYRIPGGIGGDPSGGTAQCRKVRSCQSWFIITRPRSRGPWVETGSITSSMYAGDRSPMTTDRTAQHARRGGRRPRQRRVGSEA